MTRMTQKQEIEALVAELREWAVFVERAGLRRHA